MTGNLVSLDAWRDLATLNATKRRRHAVQHGPETGTPKNSSETMQICVDEVEDFLIAAPAVSILETMAKAKYLIQLFSTTDENKHPRRQTLTDMTLKEIDELFE